MVRGVAERTSKHKHGSMRNYHNKEAMNRKQWKIMDTNIYINIYLYK